MVAKVISILNEKGGVGKTTISLHLSRILSKVNDWKVLSIDNDPQGNLTGSLLSGQTLNPNSNIFNLYDKKEGDEDVVPMQIDKNLKLIGSDSTLSSKLSSSDIDLIYKMYDALEKFKNDYDFIIIDCLPSFGQLNMSALMASDYVIIPVTPDDYAVTGLNSLIKKISKVQELKKRAGGSIEILGILLNMVEGRKTIIQTQFIEELNNKYKGHIFENILYKSSKYSEASLMKKSIVEYDIKVVGKSFLKFVKEALMRIQSGNKNKINNQNNVA
jgi:chromosome partitioning protein